MALSRGMSFLWSKPELSFPFRMSFKCKKSGQFREVIKGEAIFEPQNLLVFEHFFGIIFSLFKRTYDLLIMSDSIDDLPFSQRYGYVPVVQQLALGEIPTAFREEIKALLDEVIQQYGKGYIDCLSVDIFRDIFINFFGGSYKQFLQNVHKIPEYHIGNTTYYNRISLKKNFVINFLFNFLDICKLFKLFDLLEELIKNQEKLELYTHGYDNSGQLFGDVLKELFKKHHLAYTIYNGKIKPISNEFEGKTYVAALDETKDTGQLGAHSHLLKAGEQINHEKWADSVRESISAVEAVCRQIVGENATLGSALNEIEKNYPLHPAFKKALSALYGFTSDENGIRHSLLDKSSAAVDEADALFMLGACASFVSYLLSRTRLKDDK
ncbi:AbiJ-NTD4 domain-containing protein [Bartonella apihabitans]|uniref:AbiJ-NTD4 domain-containing protein n=1 Tax=Bartonella apihabitans TaxID=2750929 RepID=UPI003997D7BF